MNACDHVVVNEAIQTLDEFPIFDVAILSHGFAPHGRDYLLVAETNWSEGRAGQYEYRFSHVVAQYLETRVRDDVWRKSWDDVYTVYGEWERAGHPDGYVWGACWSLAYPGKIVTATSPRAEEWSGRVGRAMVELSVETDRFLLTLVFHAIEVKKLNDDRALIDRVTIPLLP
jgi:hypothetical protein